MNQTVTVFRREAHGAANEYPFKNQESKTMKVKRADGTEVDINVLLAQADLGEKALIQAMAENAKLRTQLLAAQAKSTPSAEGDDLTGDSRTRFVPDPQRAMNERTQNAWRNPIGHRDSSPDPKPPPAPKGAPPGWVSDPVAAMNERTQNAWKKPLLHSKVSGS